MDDAEWSEWTRPGVDSTNCTACSVCVGKSWRDRKTDRQTEFYRSLDGNAGPHREQLRPAERERTVIRSRSVPRRNPKAPSNDAELSAKASASSTWQTTTSAEYFSARISTQWKKFENRSIFCEEDTVRTCSTVNGDNYARTVSPLILTRKSYRTRENFFFSLSNTLLTIVSATRVFLTNGILFRPTALARRTSVTDGRTDRRTDRLAVTSVAIAGIPNAQCQANSC